MFKAINEILYIFFQMKKNMSDINIIKFSSRIFEKFIQ